jgi:hypothetical protein
MAARILAHLIFAGTFGAACLVALGAIVGKDSRASKYLYAVGYALTTINVLLAVSLLLSD